MNKALPSAENPIALQNPASAAAAKATHAKLRKRPEDEVPADPTAAAPTDAAATPTDQDVLVAQAAPAAAAEGSASAGGGAAAAPAEGAASTGGSAGAGATVPVAAGGGGIGLGTLALGGAGVGLAVAGAHGGGGGGGAAPAPAVTPAPTPGPTPVMLIHGFSEYTAANNQGGATAATNATADVSPGHTSLVDISGGFARGALPKALGDLRPMSYNVSGANAATINDGGIVVDLQGNPDARVTAHSDAAGSSNLMWMQNLLVRDQASQGVVVSIASATAAGAGSDAEIGIQHLSMDLAGSGSVNGLTDLTATATAGGAAHALASDVNLHVDSSAIGTTLAPVSSYIHMGNGEGSEPGLFASASGAGSSANVGVAGNVSLSGHGDDIYVYNSGVFAQGTNGGSAHTDIGGNMTFASTGRDAHAYALVDASTDGGGSVGDVHVHGNVELQSTASESALTRAAVHADGGGTVEIDGHLNLDSSGPAANSFMQVSAQGGDGHVSVGSLGMHIAGGGHGWMDLYTDHSGGLNIGAVNLTAATNSDVTLHVQNANDALSGGSVDGTFLGHGDGTANVSIATANLGGAGEMHMFLNSQTFGTINQAGTIGRLDLHYQLADHDDFPGVGSAPMTTINGYSASHDEVTYNGVLADATNFTDAGSFNSLAALNTGLDAALDGTHKYVFAVYNGTEDINHNGIADDHNAGILAWDDNGTGVSSVLVLPGVTALAATDLAWPAPPPPPPPPVA